jgi:hypothetical protein
MRLKRSRVKCFYHKKAVTQKDKEGGTFLGYQSPFEFSGEAWPANGKLQAQQYGQRLPYIMNLKIEGKYKKVTDENGILHYLFQNGMDVTEGDGICLCVDKDSEPDYRILSIKPYTPLRLEVEKQI